MRPREDYSRHLLAVFILTLAILAAFEVYVLREPDRIASVEAADKQLAVSKGQALFTKSCGACHGSDGEGDVGPALNDKTFLNTTGDDTIFSLISSGVPGTQMPAWNQSHGGPLTDEDVNQLVAFMRAWEPKAPDRQATPVVGDATRGAAIFAGVCSICHGQDGQGKANGAPALNDRALLLKFDDAWFKDTITKGRPANGMPTWGTVLSPGQIADVLALLDQWRDAPVTAVRPSNTGGNGSALTLTGDVAAGAQVFADKCTACHGPAGQGGVPNAGSTDGTVPPLNPIDPTLLDKDTHTMAANLDLFIEHGSTPEGPNPALKMIAWGDEKKLTPQQIADVIAYVISLNK